LLVVILVLVIAAGAVVVGIGSLLLGSGRRFDDVERFHVARSITTEWARNAVTTPLVSEPERDAQHSRDGQHPIDA
jgi:hypothetical protein